MPVLEISVVNVAANQAAYDVLSGYRSAQINPRVRATSIRLLAKGNAIGLTHQMFVGDRNPLETSVVPVDGSTVDLLKIPDDEIIGGVVGAPTEIIRLNLAEIAGTSTTDYRARIIVSEMQ